MVQLLLEKRAANLAEIWAAREGPDLLLLLQWLAGVCAYERLINVLVQSSIQSGLQQCPRAFLLHPSALIWIEYCPSLKNKSTTLHRLMDCLEALVAAT